MGHNLAWLNETMNHAMQCHPRQTGRSGEFWQNVVHWRREWQTTSEFLPWESHEQYEKAKRYDTERWTPRLLSVQYATGEEQRNNSRSEQAESKWKQRPPVDVSGVKSKVRCYKEQYCIGTWKVHKSRGIVSGQTGYGKSEHWHFRNQWSKTDQNGWT